MNKYITAGESLPPLPLPLVVLSDLHLGHPATLLNRVEELQPLLEGAATAVFNGDTFEMTNLHRREQARQWLNELLALCQSLGIKPILTSGNHDPAASSLHYLDLAQGQVLVTHGDVFHPGVAPWSRDAPYIREERRRLSHHRPEPRTLDELCHLAKQSALPVGLSERNKQPGRFGQLAMVGRMLSAPRRVAIALHYWANMVHYARQLRESFRPNARFILAGHSHRPGVWPNRDFTFINTGSFQPLSHPLVVRLANDGERTRLTVRRCRRQAEGAYFLDREVHHAYLHSQEAVASAWSI